MEKVEFRLGKLTSHKTTVMLLVPKSLKALIQAWPTAGEPQLEKCSEKNLFRTIPSGAQGLALTVCSGTTPGKAWNHMDIGNSNQSCNHYSCFLGKHITSFTTSSVPGTHFVCRSPRLNQIPHDCLITTVNDNTENRIIQKPPK